MTTDEKNRIVNMRRDGRSLTEIADALGLSRNTVKSFCRRNGLTVDMPELIITDEPCEKPCQFCGQPVMQSPGRREKKFCSDTCRTKFWNAHIGKIKRDAMQEYRCPACGGIFYAYDNRHRKYCSHECYIEARFGGAACN